MAAINTRTVLLQATSPRVLSIGLPASVAAAQAQADLALGNAALAQSAADTANNALTDIANDNILSKGEKPAIILQWQAIQDEATPLYSRGGALGAIAERDIFNTKYVNLSTYMGTIDYNILTTDTIIDGPTFRLKFSEYYIAKVVLLNAIDTKAHENAAAAQAKADTAFSDAAAAQESATIANNNIADIASDSMLSPVEKQSLRLEWNVVVSEKAGINTTSSTYPATATENTTYNTAFQALGTYLNGGVTYTISTTTPPAWINDANLSSNTAIVGATFRSTWKSMYDARQALLNDISVEAGKVAVWATVIGTGRPEDNATVGAPSGTLVGSTLAQTVESNASTALANAATANAVLAIIADDNKLSKGEKPAVMLQWQAIQNEATPLYSLGGSLGNITQRDAYDAAFVALFNYMGTLDYSTLTTDTTIVGTTFRSKFSDYYAAKIVLTNANDAAAATKANWSNIAGQTDAPADNATVGAPSGTLVAGVSADTLVAQAAAGNNTATAFASPPVISGLTDVDEHSIVNGSNRLIQTLSVSMTGGEAPYTYVWIEDGPCFLSAYTGASVELRGSGNNVLHTGRVTCTGRDAKGRFSSMSIAYTAGFGSE